MQPALWLSRHTPTPDQLADAERMGYTITAIPEGQQLGALDIRDEGDLKALVTAALGLCAEHGCKAIFGVFAAPVLWQVQRTGSDREGVGVTADSPIDGGIPCYAAWNVQRTPEGGKPTFAHRRWVPIGHLSQASCRWLG